MTAVCRAANGAIDRADVLPASSSQGPGLGQPDEEQQTQVMLCLQLATGDRIIEPMIALSGCSTREPILVAGSKSMELMMDLQRRGYLLAAAAGNCGRPSAQYDVALVDWRRRTLHALEATMDWLANFLSPSAVMVIWFDAQKPAATESQPPILLQIEVVLCVAASKLGRWPIASCA
jgi:hypothetical protein